MKILLELFLSFFHIGILSFGGGYAAMPLIKEQVVELHGWLSMAGFADIITIAEMTPGPIAVNCATFVGIQVAGIPGALVATAGNITPSCIIVTALAYVYYKYRGLDAVKAVLASLRPAIIAMIASAGLTLLTLSLAPDKDFFPIKADLPVDPIALAIFAAAFIAGRCIKVKGQKISPMWIIAGSGVMGLILYGIF
ncbi:MAG: chromate transporter [Butyrivibrio sp.]|nr:chromate transporter [Butyrivibrio sp.]